MNYTRNSYLETAECALCGGDGFINIPIGIDACPACTRMAEAEWKLGRRKALHALIGVTTRRNVHERDAMEGAA